MKDNANSRPVCVLLRIRLRVLLHPIVDGSHWSDKSRHPGLRRRVNPGRFCSPSKWHLWSFSRIACTLNYRGGKSITEQYAAVTNA